MITHMLNRLCSYGQPFAVVHYPFFLGGRISFTENQKVFARMINKYCFGQDFMYVCFDLVWPGIWIVDISVSNIFCKKSACVSYKTCESSLLLFMSCETLVKKKYQLCLTTNSFCLASFSLSFLKCFRSGLFSSIFSFWPKYSFVRFFFT